MKFKHLWNTKLLFEKQSYLNNKNLEIYFNFKYKGKDSSFIWKLSASAPGTLAVLKIEGSENLVSEVVLYTKF